MSDLATLVETKETIKKDETNQNSYGYSEFEDYFVINGRRVDKTTKVKDLMQAGFVRYDLICATTRNGRHSESSQAVCFGNVDHRVLIFVSENAADYTYSPKSSFTWPTPSA